MEDKRDTSSSMTERTANPTSETEEIASQVFGEWALRYTGTAATKAEIMVRLIARALEAFALAAVEKERERAWQIVLHEAKHWPATDETQDPFVNIYKRIRSGERL